MNLVRRLEECRDSVTHCGELAAISPMIYTRSVLWAVETLVSSLTDPAMSVEDKEPLACMLRSLIRSYRGSSDEIDKKVKMDLNVKSLLYRLSTFIRTPNDDTLLPLVENLQNRDIVTELGDNSGQLDRLCAQMTLFLPRGPRMRHADHVQARLDSLRASSDQKNVEISLLERDLARAEDTIAHLNQQVVVTVNTPAVAIAPQPTPAATGPCTCGAEAELELAKKSLHEQSNEYADIMAVYERKESELRNCIEHANLLEAEVTALNRQLQDSVGANGGVTVSVALDRAAQLTAENVNLQAELKLATTKQRVQEQEFSNAAEEIKRLQSRIAEHQQNVHADAPGSPPVPGPAIVRRNGGKVKGSVVANVSGALRRVRRRDENTNTERMSRTSPTNACRRRLSSGSDPEEMEDGMPPRKVLVVDTAAVLKDKAKDGEREKETEDTAGQGERKEAELSKKVAPVSNVLHQITVDRRDEIDCEMPSEKDDQRDIFDDVDNGTATSQPQATADSAAAGQEPQQDEGEKTKSANDQDTQQATQAPIVDTDTGVKDKNSNADGGNVGSQMDVDTTQNSERDEKEEEDEEKDKPKLKPRRPTSGLHQALDDEMCKILEEEDED